MISFQIQKMVISGGNFKPEALKPKEVVSLLLDDAELECKCKRFLRRFDRLLLTCAPLMMNVTTYTLTPLF